MIRYCDDCGCVLSRYRDLGAKRCWTCQHKLDRRVMWNELDLSRPCAADDCNEFLPTGSCQSKVYCSARCRTRVGIRAMRERQKAAT